MPKETRRRSRGIALHIVDPIARMGWVVNATPWPLDPAERGPY
jgi:hypothetical protein